MSGFDVQMRSDAMVYPMRQHAADQEVESIRQMGDSVNNMLATRQQQAESDAKIASWEVERQVNQRKLMELEGVDMAETRRLQNELQREQVESLRLANEDMRERAKVMGPKQKFALERKKLYAEIFGKDPAFIFDQDKDDWRASTPDEKKARIEFLRASRYERVGDTTGQRIARNARAAADLTKLIQEASDEGDEASVARYQGWLEELQADGDGAPVTPRAPRPKTGLDAILDVLK